MSPTPGALLLKAIRSLPDDEQEQLLVSLLDRVAGPAQDPGHAPGAGPAPGARPAPDAEAAGLSGIRLSGLLRSLPVGLAPLELRFGPPPLAGLSSSVAAEHGLKVLPVRLPTGDYERLRAWSKQHDFSMAVIVRTLVERFLNSQPPPATTP
jgi:hypothetical protein